MGHWPSRLLLLMVLCSLSYISGNDANTNKLAAGKHCKPCGDLLTERNANRTGDKRNPATVLQFARLLINRED